MPPGEKEHFHEGKIQTAFTILLDPVTLSQQVFLLFTHRRWCHYNPLTIIKRIAKK